MSVEEMNARAHRIADELFNQRDLAVVDEIFSRGLVHHTPDEPVPRITRRWETFL